MTIKNVLLALALAAFALAGCTQNTTFGISANVLAFVDEADESGNLPVDDATIDVLGADGIALSSFGVSESQAAGIDSFTLNLALALTADQDNDDDIEAAATIFLSESSPPNDDIATGSVTLAAGAQDTLTLEVDIDANDTAQIETLQSGNAVIGVRLQVGTDGDNANSVNYVLQTFDLGGSYTPSEALSF